MLDDHFPFTIKIKLRKYMMKILSVPFLVATLGAKHSLTVCSAAMSLIIAVASKISLASATLWYLLALGTNEMRSK